MLDEAREAPDAVGRLLAADRDVYASLGRDLRAQPPRSLLTVARGSSDHAAQYMAYLIMARLGRLVTSLPMSLITLYQSRLQCDDLVSIAFSQSAQSPDLVVPMRFFRDGRARTVAVVNDVASPLAQAAQWVLPLHAGVETSIAATKSYIAQLVAGARLTAAWQDDAAFQRGLDALPDALQRAARQDWQSAVEALADVDKLLVIGRGTGLAIAMEAALKFKEVCGIQAEAFSGAELRHGPLALVDENYPLLVLAPRGPAQRGLLDLADDLRQRGARGNARQHASSVHDRCRGPRCDRGNPELLSDGRGARMRTRSRSRRAASSDEDHTDPMSRSRRRFGQLCAIVAIICTLFTADARAAADKVHVEFWTMSLKPKFTPYFKTLVQQYEAAHPNVELEWVDVPWDVMQTKLTAAIVARSAPALVQLNVPWAYDYSLYGALRQVDDLLGEDRALYTDGAIAVQ